MFLSGYLSFDDVVVASVLFLFALVLSSEEYSLLELLGLDFRTECISLSTADLNFWVKKGFYHVLVLPISDIPNREEMETTLQAI